MKTWQKHIPLVLAIVFAAITSFTAHEFLKNREGVSIAQPVSTAPVVVAKRDLPMGIKLTLEDMTTRQWPVDAAQSQFLRSSGPIVGRTTRSHIVAEEPITEAKLMREGENLSSLIPSDMRGVTVRIRKSYTLEQMLDRGSLVDVIAIRETDKGLSSTKVIAQSVRVLSVNVNATAKEKDIDSKFMEVTLLVTPRDAEWILYAVSQGEIALSLRNDRSEEQEKIFVSTNEVSNGEEKLDSSH